MKHIKKVVTLFLAFAMVLAMSSIAFAADGDDTPTGKTINLTGGKAGHTYTLYQIFTGTVDGTELTNIQWGNGVTDTFKATKETAAAYAAEIAEADDARATAQALVAADALTGGTPLTLSADGDVVFEDLAEGYYVIVDTNNNTGVVEGDYSSAYIVKVVEDVSGAIKGSGASSDKEVIDPETGAASTTDAAAYNIGDAVPFKLTATTADNVAAYKKYHITFQDKLSDGLDPPTSYTVKVLGHTFTVPASGNDPDPATTTDGTKITVTKVTAADEYTFAIKVEFEPVAVGDTPAATYLNAQCNNLPITVEYTSVLNSDAEIGLPGNDNDMHITYSNNPEDEDGSEEGKTPDDKVKVFTYKTVIDKVDADGNALAGAGFTIYQEVKEGTVGAQLGSAIKEGLTEGVEASKLADAKYYVPKAMTTVSGNNAQFEFNGLADGKYVLVETKIPAGFNAFDSVEFTISSTVTDTEITELTGTDPFTTENPGADGAVTAENGHELDSGELYAEIENNSGAELPDTGGIGTVIFYVLGLALIIGCGIVLVSRKRLQK